MLKLFWHCLNTGEKERNFVNDNLKKLSNLLMLPPVGIALEVNPLPPSLVEVFESIYEPWCNQERPFCYFCKQIRIKLDSLDLKNIPLLVYCKGNSKLAESAVKEKPLAQWGLTNDYYFVSAVYKPDNEYLLWHEALHLFGVEDCHNGRENPGPTCELLGCIMQYVPIQKNVCPWPFLCQENIKRIQAWSEKHKLNDIT